MRGVCSQEVPANSFAEIVSWDQANQYFNIRKPSRNNLPFAKTVIVSKLMPPNTPGIIYLDGIHHVKKSGTVVQWDKVGTVKDSWEAGYDVRGIFRVLHVSGDDLLIRVGRPAPNLVVGATWSGPAPLCAMETDLTKIEVVWSFYCDMADGGAGHDGVRAVAFDSFGNIYAPSSQITVKGVNYTFWKLSPSGKFIWGKDIGEGIFPPTSHSAVAVDKYDNVYVAGYNSGTGRCTLYKFDSHGNQIWTSEGSGNDHTPTRIEGIDFDTDDNVIIAGGRSLDGNVSKLNGSTGLEIWTYSTAIAPEDGNNSWTYDVAADLADNSIVVGGSVDINDTTNYYSLWKLTTAGVLTWGKSFPYTALSSYAILYNVVVGSGSYIYCGSTFWGGTAEDPAYYTLCKVPGNGGTVVWAKAVECGPRGLGLDANDNVFYAALKCVSVGTCSANIWIYNSSGTFLCKYNQGYTLRSLAVRK